MKIPSKNKRMVLYILDKVLEYIEEVDDFSHKISEQNFYNNKGKVSASRKKIIKEEKNTVNRNVWRNIENISKVKAILFQEFDFS